MTEAHTHFITVNPATGRQVEDRAYADDLKIEESLERLHRGFLSWKKKTVFDRQKILLDVAREFRILKTEFVQTITKTMGKPIVQSEAEFDKSVEAVEYLCKMDLDFLQTRFIHDLTKRHEIYREPIGVIVGVMPWNFPLWQAVRMVFPSLIIGNTVLLKHAEITAQVGDLFLKAFDLINRQHSIFDHQVFAHQLTEKIVSDRRVGGISLTGSIRSGKIVSEIAGRHLKRGVFELGGSDPSLVFADCDLEATVKAVLRSRFMNSGQTCISTKRVFVERRFLNKFMDRAVALFKAYKSDDPMNSTTKIGPLSHLRFKSEFNMQMQAVALLSETVAENKLDISPNEAAFVSPKVLLFDKHIDFFKTNEIFGPALCVIPFDSEAQALDDANSTIFGLGASVYTSDPRRIENLTRELVAGQVSVNHFVTSDARLPFGGQKHSGLGRELGEDGFLEFLQTKVVSYELGAART